MRAVAIINQKGGVGKTTTAVNLGAAMAFLGRRVLLVDLDPQCNLTVHVDQDPAGELPSVYELVRGEATLAEIVRPTHDDNLFVAPASVDLAGAELELAGEVGRETILAEAFEAYDAAGHEPFDYVLLDCPPSLGLLAINALVASSEVYVPVQAEFFSLQGVSKILEITALVQRRLNPRLHITAVIACRYDGSTKLSQAVLSELQQHFGDTVLKTRIRRNVKLAEAPSHGLTIFGYDRVSRGAEDYLALACEVLGIDEVPVLEPLPEPLDDAAPTATPVAHEDGAALDGRDARRADAPGADVAEVPAADAPGADVAGADAPGADAPGADVAGVPDADALARAAAAALTPSPVLSLPPPSAAATPTPRAAPRESAAEA